MQTKAGNVIPQNGLVEIEDGWSHGDSEGARETIGKGLGAMIVGGFLLVIFGTGALDLLHPLEKPTLLGQELEKDQAKRLSANLWDGSLARVFEDDYALTSRVRERAARPYSRFLLEKLQESSGSVLIGPSGWMFDGQRLDYQAVEPARAARRASVVIRALDRRLASRGISLVPILIPRKSSIHAERLPFGVRAQAQLDWTMGPTVAEVGLRSVDLSAAFLAWDGPPVFRAADTHWSAVGMRLAAEEVAQSAGLLAKPDDRLGVLYQRDELTIARPGDLVRKLGLELDDSDKRHYDYGLWEVGLPPLTPATEGGPGALLVGTSFSSEGFEKFLSHYTGRHVLVAAYGGKTTFQSLALGLKGALEADAVPSTVFAEFPNYQLLRLGAKPNWWTLPAGFLPSMALFLPKEALKLEASPRLRARGLSIGEALPKKPVLMLVDLPEGGLCRSGDGVVELDLDMEVTAGAGALIIDSGTMRASLPLGTGRQRHVLPLVDDRGLTSRVRLILQDKGGLEARIHGLEFITAGSKIEGSEVPVAAPEEGQHQWVVWPEPRRIQTQDALHLGRDDCGASVGIQIQCFLGQTPVGKPWTSPSLQPGAPVVLSLAPLAGAEIDRVRVQRNSAADAASDSGGDPESDPENHAGSNAASGADPSGPLLRGAFLSRTQPPPSHH